MDAKVHEIHFKVDDENLETTEKQLSVGTIIEMAEEDQATHYLQLVHGGKPGTEYKDLSELVELHEGIEFVTVFTGPTHVS